MSKQNKAVSTDVKEGTLVADGSLRDLHDQFVAVSEKTAENMWTLGAILSAGKALCEDKEAAALEGYTDDTGRKRYGQWCKDCVRDAGINYDTTTLLKLRKVHELWGDKRDKVKKLSHSALMELSADSLDQKDRNKLIRGYNRRSKPPVIKEIREDMKAAREGTAEESDDTGKGADMGPTLEGIYKRAYDLHLDNTESRDTALDIAKGLTSSSYGAAQFTDDVRHALLGMQQTPVHQLVAIQRAITLTLTAKAEENQKAAEDLKAKRSKIKRASRTKAQKAADDSKAA